jgi:hypothetical protein
MNRSYSKIRHIQESNQRLEKRLFNEQENTNLEPIKSYDTQQATHAQVSM